MTDDMEAARRRRERRRSTTPAGTFGPSWRKQQRITIAMAKVRAAEERSGRAFAGKTPTRERITMALNLRYLYGPEVDRALGGEEPMVDEWEAGIRIPTEEQIKALAELTDFPIGFFYLPPATPITGGVICGPDGCRSLVDEPPR